MADVAASSFLSSSAKGMPIILIDSSAKGVSIDRIGELMQIHFPKARFVIQEPGVGRTESPTVSDPLKLSGSRLRIPRGMKRHWSGIED